MKKIISFSLWGDKAMYTVGAILNAQLAQEHFPEWTCVFYYDKTVPGIYIKALEQFLPGHCVMPINGRKSGAVNGAPYGNAGVLPISYTYIKLCGAKGLLQSA